MTALLATLTALMTAHPLLTALAYMILGAMLVMQHSVTRLNRLLAESAAAYWAELEAQWEAQRLARENAPRRVWSFEA